VFVSISIRSITGTVVRRPAIKDGAAPVAFQISTAVGHA
jgi:hypothetical protein